MVKGNGAKGPLFLCLSQSMLACFAEGNTAGFFVRDLVRFGFGCLGLARMSASNCSRPGGSPGPPLAGSRR